jgi:hypothetical protein
MTDQKPTHLLMFNRMLFFVEAFKIVRESNTYFFTDKFRVHKTTRKAVVSKEGTFHAPEFADFRLGTEEDVAAELERKRVHSSYLSSLAVLIRAGQRAHTLQCASRYGWPSDRDMQAVSQVAHWVQVHNFLTPEG